MADLGACLKSSTDMAGHYDDVRRVYAMCEVSTFEYERGRVIVAVETYPSRGGIMCKFEYDDHKGNRFYGDDTYFVVEHGDALPTDADAIANACRAEAGRRVAIIVGSRAALACLEP